MSAGTQGHLMNKQWLNVVLIAYTCLTEMRDEI